MYARVRMRGHRQNKYIYKERPTKIIIIIIKNSILIIVYRDKDYTNILNEK